MSERPHHALFLCTQNSARSMLAESIMNKLAKDESPFKSLDLPALENRLAAIGRGNTD